MKLAKLLIIVTFAAVSLATYGSDNKPVALIHLNKIQTIVGNTLGDTTMSLADSAYLGSFDTLTGSYRTMAKINYEYDSGGMQIRTISKQPDKTGLNWQNATRTDKTFTGSLLSQELIYNWNSDFQAWTPTMRTSYFYNSENILDSYTEQLYNEDSTLTFSKRYSYIYIGNQLNTITTQIWNANLQQWNNQLKITYSYSDGLINTLLTQAWSQNLNGWTDFERSQYFYQNQQPTELKTERYDQNSLSWSWFSRYLYSYNIGKNNLETEELQYYIDDNWKQYSQAVFSFENDQIKSKINKLYIDWISGWREINKTDYYYSEHEVFGVEENIGKITYIQNPVKSGSMVQLNNLDRNLNYELRLISVNGNIAVALNMNGSDSLTFSHNFSEGIYLLVITQKGVLTGIQKIIIVK